MCDVYYIKKARYSGQDVAPVLGALLIHAYKEAKAAEDKSKDFDLWCKKQEDKSFVYFFGILLNINQLVRSIREASFDLCCISQGTMSTTTRPGSHTLF